MSTARHIAIVTGSRAEWGLLSHLAHTLAQQPGIRLSVVATGSHLDPRFGMTVGEIESAGFTVAARVPMSLAGDRGRDVAEAMARVSAGMAQALDTLRPDIVVVLGDRYEILATATTATALGLVVAHIHGGEITEGAIDDSIRHAITKLSHLHFASAAPYRDRIIQMGEVPDRVFDVGALGVDAIARTERFDRVEIERRLGIPLRSPLLLVTYHPVTIEGEHGGAGIEPLVSALERFDTATVVVTGVNADAAHAAIQHRLDAFAAAHPDRVVLRTSLGQRLYLSVMAVADAVVGNSSSGVIEAPIMQVPTVNIGDRQAGRLMPPSVICCAPQTEAITAAITRALDPGFRKAVAAASPFGAPGTADRIAVTLASVPLEGLKRKRFFDLPR